MKDADGNTYFDTNNAEEFIPLASLPFGSDYRIPMINPISGQAGAMIPAGSIGQFGRKVVDTTIAADSTSVSVSLPSGYTIDDLTSFFVLGPSGVIVAGTVEEDAGDLVFPLFAYPTAGDTHTLRVFFSKTL